MLMSLFFVPEIKADAVTYTTLPLSNSMTKTYYSGAYRLPAGTYTNVSLTFYGDSVIYVAAGDTVTLKNTYYSYGSALNLSSSNGGSIYLKVDGTLNVQISSTASTNTGGKPAIAVPSSSRTFIGGSGSITVKGQNGGSRNTSSGYAGGGGGAGIGSAGGKGGTTTTIPAKGGDFGEIYITDTVKISGYGGSGNTGIGKNNGSAVVNGEDGYLIGSGGHGGYGDYTWSNLCCEEWTDYTSVEYLQSNYTPSYGLGNIYLNSNATVTNTSNEELDVLPSGEGYNDKRDSKLTTGTYTMSLPSSTPSAPTGLSATSSSYNTMIVSWSAGSGATGSYSVYYKKSTDTTYSCVETTGTSVSLSSLSNATTYDIYVRAVNAAGMSPTTSTIQATTLDARPSAPANLKAEKLGNGSVKLTWDASTSDGDGKGSLRYKILFKINGTTRSGYYDYSTSGRTLTGLDGTKTYSFSVVAINKSNLQSAESNAVEVYIDEYNPSPPTNLKAVSSGSDSIKLTWTAPSNDGDGLGNLKYNVYYGTNSNDLQKYPSQLTSDQSVTGLTAGQKYYFKVSSVNTSGSESSLTSAVVAVPYSASFSGGSGTASDPYLISHAGDLINLENYVNSSNSSYNSAYYKMTNNIDMSGIPCNTIGYAGIDNGWNDSSVTNDFEALIYNYDCGYSYSKVPFKGSFDGGGYILYDFYPSTSVNFNGGYWCVGLFGLTQNATIKNLGLYVEDIYDCDYGNGGIVGYADDSTIENCFVYEYGQNGEMYAGGIVGISDYSTISNCYYMIDAWIGMPAEYAEFGAIAGYYNGLPSSISNCYYSIGSGTGLVGFGNTDLTDVATSFSSAEISTVTASLNSNRGTGAAWTSGDECNNGFPTFANSIAYSISYGPAGGAFPAATYGQPYSHKLVGSGGLGDYTFGTLDFGNGLSLSSDGTISGTPTKAGSVTVNSSVEDGWLQYNSGSVGSITINATAPDAPGISVAGSNGSVTVECLIPDSGWSDGDGLTGQPSGYYVYYGKDQNNLTKIDAQYSIGQPAVISEFESGGIYYFQVEVANSSGLTAKSEIASAEAYQPLSYPGGEKLPIGTFGTEYSASVATATGGYGDTTYELALGSMFPGGLTLNSNGTITGIPECAGTYNFMVTATNSAGSVETTTPYSLQILAIAPGVPRDVSAVRDGGGSVKLTWTVPVADGAGIYSYTYKVYYGTDENNLTDSVVLTPGGSVTGLTDGETYYFRVAAVNGYKIEGEKSTAVSAVPYSDFKYQPPNYDSESKRYILEDGSYGVAYSVNLADYATGGYGETVYSLATGGDTLPHGFKLENGILSGKTSGDLGSTGDFDFTVTVSHKYADKDAIKSYSIPFRLTINALAPGKPTITSADRAASGSVKVAWTAPEYSGAYVTAYKLTWYDSSGQKAGDMDVPVKIMYDKNFEATVTGLTDRQTYSFTVHAINSAGNSEVSDAKSATPYADLVFESKALATAVRGSTYIQDVKTAKGALGEYTYAVPEGSMPSGLYFSSDGLISGTPTVSGTYTITVTVTDSSGETKDAKFVIGVVDSLEFSDGTGAEIKPFLISTADDMKKLATLILGGNTFEGKYFKLTNDLTLSNWDNGYYYSGANSLVGFAGTFDGDYHEIKYNTSNSGLFGNLLSGATVKNLGTSGVFWGSIQHPVGGIADYSSSATITNCYNDAEIEQCYEEAGGIVGFAEDTEFTNCYNQGEINGRFSIGGIVGYSFGLCTFTNCYNAGDILVQGNYDETETIFGNICAGYYDPLGNYHNDDNYVNCYGISNANEYGTFVDAPYVTYYSWEEMKTADFVSKLGSGYKRDKAYVNWGCPILAGRRPADITVEWNSMTQDYDGSAKSASVTAKNSNGRGVILEEGDYSITYNGSAEAPSKVGTYNTAVEISDTGSLYFNLTGGGTSTFTINPVAPTAPTNLAAEKGLNASVKLTWTVPEDDGGSDITSYNVYYREKNTENEQEWTKVEGITLTEYTVENLTAKTPYEFKVTALNGTEADDESTASEIVEITPAKEPAAPTIGEIISKNASALITSIDVADNFGDAVNKYIIYTSTDGENFTKHTEIETSTDSSKNVLVEGLTNGTTYQIKVAAVNDYGESEMSNAQTVTVGMPLPPKNVKAVPQPGQKIEITFDAADAQGSKIVGYEVHIGGTNDGVDVDPEASENIIFTESTSLIYDASDRINGDTVTAYVVAVSDVFENAKSANSETAIAALGSPSAPEITDLTADAQGIDLSWTASVSNGNSRRYYDVTIVDENGNEQDFRTEKSTTLSMRITTEQYAFEPGKTYGVYVTCWNTAGEGPASKTWTFTFGAPQAPEVEEPEMGDKELTVKWSKPAIDGGAEIIGYNIYLNDETEATMYVTWHSETAPYQLYITDYRKNNGEVAYGSGQDNLDNFEVVVDNLANGFAYSVRVTAVNVNGEGPSQEIEEPVTPATKASAPRDIVANATSANDITISWNKPFRDGGTAVSGYFVSVIKTGEKNYETGDYDDVSSESEAWSGMINVGTTAEVGNLEAGSRYEVKVAANTAAGQGEFGTATVYTHARPSKPVITELISGVGETKTLPLTVSWNAPEDIGDSPIIGYDVYANRSIYPNDKFKMNLEGMIAADKTEYVINDIRLENGTEYDITVVAYNAVTGTEYNNGVSSDIKTITLGTVPPPKNIKAAGDVLGNLNITWSTEQYAGIEQYIDRYIVYLDGVAVTSTNTNLAELKMIPKGVEHKIEVSVFSTFQQEGLKSEPIYYTIGAPEAVTGVNAQPAENGAIVTWTEVPAVDTYNTTAYKVYVNGEVKQTINVSEATELKAELDGLTGGTEYSINVSAVNANGEGQKSDTVKVTPYAKPDAPIVKNIKGGIGSFSFTFDEPNGNGGTITGYEIFVDGNEVQASFADNTVTVTGVEDGEPAHEFYIIAVSDKGLKSDAPEDPYEVVTGVPTPPENVTVIAGPGSATIIFDKSDDVDPDHPTTDYEVLDNGVPLDPQPEITETEDGKLIVTITPLEDGTEHSITIRPINDIGTGPESDPVVVKPGTPQAPEISKIVSGNGKLSVEWTEPEENSGRILYYTVYVSDGEGSDYTLAATTPITNAEIGDLTNGKSYLVKISATNYIGEGAMSDPMSGTPGAASGPVGEITAVPGYADGSCNITLTWDKPEDNGGLSITEYIVEGEGVITVDSANRTAVITGLDKGTEYTYTITPVNSAGNGESKTTESITTLTEPGAPEIKAGDGINRMATIRWVAPQNTSSAEITGYVIYVRPLDGSDTIRIEYNQPAVGSDGRYTYSVTEEDGVKVGYTYGVTVTAVNIAGEGVKSNEIEITITPEVVQTAPGVPRELTAAAGDGSVELSWKEPQYDGNSAITKYVIYSGTSVDSMGNVGEVDGHTFSFKRDGLKNGTTYYFKVKAVNAANADGGEFCDIVEATPTQVTAPSKPAWVTFNNETGESAYETNAQGNAMTIRWNESTGDEMFGQISYKVFVNGDLKTTTTDLSYVLENPVEDKQYNIQIKAVNEKGAESSSDFIRAYRGLNVRKSSEPGFSYPEQYQSGIYAYIDHDYDGIEDNKITPTKPSAPQNFAVTTDELNTEVILTWTAPANNGNAEITEYNVYIDGTPETLSANDSGVLLEDGSYKYSYSIMGRAVHSFYVTAINAQELEGDSTPIKYAPIEYNPAPILTAPTDLEAAEIVGKTNIVLRWTAVDGAESYVLHVNGKPIELSSDDISADETKVSYTYPGEINTHYTFAVSAKSGSNESALSNIITVDTTEEKAEAPLDVMLEQGESSIVVTWNPPANLDETDTYEYIVYINGDPVEERVSDCTYTINELKTVYVKVAAVCEHGTTGAQSETVSYEHNSVFDPSTPPKPLKLNYELKYADDGILLVNDNLELTWLPGEIVDGEHEADTETYNVYIGGNLVAEGVTGDPFIYVDGVEAGKDYLVEIEPLSADGKAGPKATINLEVPENEYQKPEKVTDLAAELSEDNTAITLTWTESSDSDTYYYLVVNGEQQANTVNSGFEYPVDNSVHNYTFMLKSAKTYSDGTEVTEDSNQAPVNIPSIDPDPTPNPPNYEANPPEFIQYISDGVKNVKVFWKAPERKENETGEIAEYKVVVEGTAVGTVSADASPLVYDIDCGSIGEKKVVEIQAYKNISGSMLLASTSVKATVTPGCNIVVNPDDYTNDNPKLPVEVTNEDSNFTGEPSKPDEKITITGKANATDFDMKLTDEFGNELKLSASDITFGNVETNGMTEFEVSFSAGDLDASATTYSVVFSRDAYTKYTVTGVYKEKLSSVDLSGVEIYSGDLDGNGVINFDDKLILLGNLNKQVNTINDGDLDENGIVNFDDKLKLVGNLNKENIVKK